MDKIPITLLILSVSLIITIALVIKLMIENRYMKKSIISITESLGVIFSALINLKEGNTAIEESLEQIVGVIDSTREQDADQIEIIKTVVEKINKLEDPFRNDNKEEKEEMFN